MTHSRMSDSHLLMQIKGGFISTKLNTSLSLALLAFWGQIALMQHQKRASEAKIQVVQLVNITALTRV